MVHLTRIYTKTGDHGQTRLVDNSVVDKTDERVEAYGTVDELNAILGLVLAGGLPAPVALVLTHVQQELFDLGADLANPVDPTATGPVLRIEADQVTRLERWCDEFGDGLSPLRSFILPGGSPGGAWLHLARTVCRRAERSAWRAAAAHGASEAAADRTVLAGSGSEAGVNPAALAYLNRLSDLLFILSRVVNGQTRETLWVPGGERLAAS
jgi:cob(I)alamin adenosyltransferase